MLEWPLTECVVHLTVWRRSGFAPESALDNDGYFALHVCIRFYPKGILITAGHVGGQVPMENFLVILLRFHHSSS